jgi:hypothetical protein
MTPQEFLLCFDGFSAAVGDKPTAKQWKGLLEQRAKVSGLGGLGGPSLTASPASVAMLVSDQQLTISPRVEATWKSTFKQALMQAGADEETARQLTEQEHVDLSLDPVQAAQAAFSLD